MASKPVIYAMIPARIGSSRLKMKNLALINGQPMIYYVIQAAKDSGSFDRIIINSDHEVFTQIADRYNVGIYLRPRKLGSSTTKSDDVVADFMHAHPQADIVAWVNPIAPLQTGEEISNVINHFIDKKLDSLVTVDEKHVHCMYNNKPVNFKSNTPFALTQDLTPLQTFVYSIMMWRKTPFLDHIEKKGFALFCGKFGVFTVSKLSAMIIKTEEDLYLTDILMRSNSYNKTINYDSITTKINENN